MVFIICYTNNTRTLEHSYFTSSQLLRQDNLSITIFQSIDDILSGSFYLVCTHLCSRMSKQPIELLLVKIKLMSKMLLDCVSPHSNTQ
jgi:hypothetical protein